MQELFSADDLAGKSINRTGLGQTKNLGDYLPRVAHHPGRAFRLVATLFKNIEYPQNAELGLNKMGLPVRSGIFA
jgi:hypothetical protein